MSRLGLSPGLSFFTMERTIGFDVDGIGGTRRLRKEEYVGFLRSALKLAPAEIEAIQVHPIAPYCFVRLPTEERMNEVFESIKHGVVWAGKGDVQPFLCTDSYTEVKVKGVVPGTPEEDVAIEMNIYGEIFSCKEFKTRIEGTGGQAGAATGDYLLKMKLDEVIPRILPCPRTGMVWVCYYEGQEDSCWRCFEPGHVTRLCSSRSDFPQQQRIEKRKLFEERAGNLDVDDEDAVEGDDDAPPADVSEEDTPPAVDDEHVNPLEPAGGAAGNVDERIPPILPEINVIPDTQEDVFADNEDDDVLALGAADVSRRMQMSSADDELLEQAAQDVSATEKQQEWQKKKNRRKSAEEKKVQAEKHRLSVSSDRDSEKKKRNKQAVSLVNSPLGDTSDGRRRSSGDLNAVPRMTPEDRQRLLGQGTSRGTYNAIANRNLKPTKEVRVPGKN